MVFDIHVYMWKFFWLKTLPPMAYVKDTCVKGREGWGRNGEREREREREREIERERVREGEVYIVQCCDGLY